MMPLTTSFRKQIPPFEADILTFVAKRANHWYLDFVLYPCRLLEVTASSRESLHLCHQFRVLYCRPGELKVGACNPTHAHLRNSLCVRGQHAGTMRIAN